MFACCNNEIKKFMISSFVNEQGPEEKFEILLFPQQKLPRTRNYTQAEWKKNETFRRRPRVLKWGMIFCERNKILKTRAIHNIAIILDSGISQKTDAVLLFIITLYHHHYPFAYQSDHFTRQVKHFQAFCLWEEAVWLPIFYCKNIFCSTWL